MPLNSEVPIVLCVRCPACGAKPGHMCQEWNRKLIAHRRRQDAAQVLFDSMAVRLRARVRAMEVQS